MGPSLVGSVVKNLLANAGDTGLILGPGGSHLLQSDKAHMSYMSHNYSVCALEPGNHNYWVST